jgi:tetratricopeptide (TPR) repeat protein
MALSRPRLFCLLLALLTLVVYLPVWHQGFIILDDGDYVSQNRIVQDGLTWAGVKWAFTSWHASNWHPLTWLSHMTDCELFGLNPGPQHLVNVLFHCANAVLLFVLLWRLTGAAWAAAMVAALFAWHPLRVESVAWISERKDVLSSFFGLLSLLCYARFVQEKSRRDYFLALVLFALGLLAKPMLVTLPFLMLLFDWWPLNRVRNAEFNLRNCKMVLGEKIPFFALAAGSCVVTFLAQRAVSVLSVEQYPLPLRMGNCILSYTKYLLKTAWPVDLAIYYPLPAHLSWLGVAAAGAGLAAISIIVWRMRAAHPYLVVGWLWFLGTLVPVIGLVQVGKAAMADRYSYLPTIGIFLAVLFLVKDLAARFRIPPWLPATAAGLILAAEIVATEHQLSYWRDDETLFGHAVAVTRDNATAQINLGVALEQEGRRDEAQSHYAEAVRVDPHSAQAHNNFANLLDDAGQTNAALEHYQAALGLDPNAPLTHANFGTLLVKLGRFNDAMEQYHEAMRLQPDNPHFYYLAGKALLRHGQSREAIAQFRHALELDADDFESLAFLARVLATDQDPQNRDGSAAVALAERANALAGGGQPLMLDVLGMAYAQAGRFAEAQQKATRALELAEGAKLPAMAAGIRQHLQSYEAGQPWREAFTNSFLPAP